MGSMEWSVRDGRHSRHGSRGLPVSERVSGRKSQILHLRLQLMMMMMLLLLLLLREVGNMVAELARRCHPSPGRSSGTRVKDESGTSHVPVVNKPLRPRPPHEMARRYHAFQSF